MGHKLTFEFEGQKTTFEFNDDVVRCNEIVRVFAGILYANGFQMPVIKSALNEAAGDINEKVNMDKFFS